jgi:hypothetical protein
MPGTRHVTAVGLFSWASGVPEATPPGLGVVWAIQQNPHDAEFYDDDELRTIHS